jgi:hypothetical protein
MYVQLPVWSGTKGSWMLSYKPQCSRYAVSEPTQDTVQKVAPRVTREDPWPRRVLPCPTAQFSTHVWGSLSVAPGNGQWRLASSPVSKSFQYWFLSLKKESWDRPLGGERVRGWEWDADLCDIWRLWESGQVPHSSRSQCPPLWITNRDPGWFFYLTGLSSPSKEMCVKLSHKECKEFYYWKVEALS